MHLDAKQGLLRLYRTGCNFETRDPFLAVISYLRLTPEILYLYGALGKLGREGIEVCKHSLRAEGIKAVIYEQSHFHLQGAEPLYNDLFILELDP
jgi:hypothetical protein